MEIRRFRVLKTHLFSLVRYSSESWTNMFRHSGSWRSDDEWIGVRIPTMLRSESWESNEDCSLWNNPKWRSMSWAGSTSQTGEFVWQQAF